MKAKFKHPALGLSKDKPLIYTAMSKHLFYFRMQISKFVLEQDGIPLNPFMIFEYFMLDTVSRDLVREGNNNLVKRADQIWVFGAVSNGVLAEIKQAKEVGKIIRYFSIKNSLTIHEVAKDEVELEEEVKEFRSQL